MFARSAGLSSLSAVLRANSLNPLTTLSIINCSIELPSINSSKVPAKNMTLLNWLASSDARKYGILIRLRWTGSIRMVLNVSLKRKWKQIIWSWPHLVRPSVISSHWCGDSHPNGRHDRRYRNVCQYVYANWILLDSETLVQEHQRFPCCYIGYANW